MSLAAKRAMVRSHGGNNPLAMASIIGIPIVIPDAVLEILIRSGLRHQFPIHPKFEPPVCGKPPSNPPIGFFFSVEIGRVFINRMPETTK